MHFWGSMLGHYCRLLPPTRRTHPLPPRLAIKLSHEEQSQLIMMCIVFRFPPDMLPLCVASVNKIVSPMPWPSSPKETTPNELFVPVANYIIHKFYCHQIELKLFYDHSFRLVSCRFLGVGGLVKGWSDEGPGSLLLAKYIQLILFVTLFSWVHSLAY